MDVKYIRNLQEAYLEVYAPQEELDEGAAGDVAARAQKLANQRKGQTPERKQMYASLASKARTREQGGPRVVDLHPGKRKGLTQSERDARREYDAEYSYETGNKNSTLGPGTITKNPRKLAQQKARGQHAEQVDIYDIILSHLLDEGYAETIESAEAIMVNMSEDWRENIMEISDRKVRAVRDAREKQWNKQFGKNRVQDPTDDMIDKVDKLIDQRNKRTGSNVKKTTLGQLTDKNASRRRGEA